MTKNIFEQIKKINARACFQTNFLTVFQKIFSDFLRNFDGVSGYTSKNFLKKEQKFAKKCWEMSLKTGSRNKEFWSARELFKLLGYTEYNKFLPAIERAKIACESSEQAVNLHFAQVSETQPSHNQHGLIQGREIKEILGLITLPLWESRGMKSSGSLAS